MRVTKKVENKQDFHKAVVPNASIHIIPTIEELPNGRRSRGNKMSCYTDRKYEAISAKVYIRNPRDSGPAVIKVSTTGSETKKPHWMILKAYESPPSNNTSGVKNSEKCLESAKIRDWPDFTACGGIKKSNTVESSKMVESSEPEFFRMINTSKGRKREVDSEMKRKIMKEIGNQAVGNSGSTEVSTRSSSSSETGFVRLQKTPVSAFGFSTAHRERKFSNSN